MRHMLRPSGGCRVDRSCRVPTVAGARAWSQATTMCNHFNVRCILFTGVAGGLQEGQQIGDLVLGSEV